MFEIDIQNEAGYSVDETRIVDAIAQVLSAHEAPPWSAITVVLTDNDEVAALNRQFRGIDAPTDVLSFPADDLPEELAEELGYLGDLVIAYPYASDQAAQLGHALMDSLSLLVIHGTLHLLGYDHDTPENRADMWAAQETALIALGIPVDIVPTLEASPHSEMDENNQDDD